MIIKSIALENIRSYKDTTIINLGTGSTLLFGDIGAGKSTLLYGLEFALFGLSDLDGKDLLRHGSDKGTVTVEMELNGKKCVIGRVLKRAAGSVTQIDGYISQDGEQTPYKKTTEMKNAILKLLDLNEESGRAGSALYRYGIFTPQDEMKAILSANEDSRLKTLRRALRADDYATAAANGDNLRKHLDREGKSLNEHAKGLESSRAARAEAESAKTELDRSARRHEAAAKEAGNAAAHKEDELERNQEIRGQMDAAKGEIAGLASAIEAKEGEITRIEKQKREAQKRKSELEAGLRETGIVISGEEDAAALREELQGLKSKISALDKESNRAQTRAEDLNALIKKGTCPTCAQKIDPRKFNAKREEAQALAEKVARQVNEVSDRARVIRSTITAVGLAAEVGEAAADIADAERRIQSLTAELEKMRNARDGKQRFLAENAGVREAIEKLQAEIEELRDLRIDETAAAAADCAKASAAEREIERLSAEIREKERCVAQAARLEKISSWVDHLLVPAIQETEKAVLEYHNLHFCTEFTNWFNLLTRAEDIRVWVDDAFAPVVQQGEYQLGLKSLSGGERTSLALAYRLALNRLVRATSPAIGDGLIILDEPTDGLHKDQLVNMRDVLDQLACGQTILVSHEEELMDCADRVIRFEKRRGVSSVVAE